MPSMDEKIKTGGVVSGSPAHLEEMKILKEMQDHNGVKKAIHSELWHACAGPLVSLPQVGSLVYYFPQGHSEQVAVSTKRSATSQIPNYPNLPAQLLCQVHNVTLHVDKETDEIFAQMSLQSVNSEKDIFHIPDFGLKPSRHPTEFFCKTLTASDTSTHGGFSVPRRAAEKLFPPLDYTMQPPTQELIVRDLHDNTWTFRHIYRGQPKRHLLTTGWSVFVGSKRLRAGDSVLFIRDEKSQLKIGVRCANRQQTALPSSVLSADSMLIGVLAAAAHAATNRSPFTVFYNPRACPSDFVIPVNKFRKAVYGTQISAGMRFGMMFETEESGKRRYMGSIVGVSDLDPLRWPGSKWRCFQVEWDEPGCGDKQNRVSPWEIETPENLFLFPSLTSGFKRQFPSGFLEYGNLMKRPLVQGPETGIGNLPYPSIPGFYSEDLIKMLLRPQAMNYPAMQGSFPCTTMLEGMRLKVETPTVTPMNPQLASSVTENSSSAGSPHLKHLHPPAHGSLGVKESRVNKIANQDQTGIGIEKIDDVEPVVAVEPEKATHLGSMGRYIDDKNTVSNAPLSSMNQSNAMNQMHAMVMPPPDLGNLNDLIQYTDVPDWLPYATGSSTNLQSPNPLAISGKQDPSASLPNAFDLGLPSSMGQELWNQHWTSVGASQKQLDPHYVQCEANANALLDMSEDAHTQSGVYSCLEFDGAANGGSTMIDPSSVSNCVMDEFPTMKDPAFQFSSDCLVGNFSSSQDLQSQITSASLADSHAFSIQDFPDNSGKTLSNVEFDESSLLQNSSWQQVNLPMRSYTKVQKAGSVGRSIDVTSFKNYNELRAAIERMFRLDGLLSDPRGSGWKLVYVDFENDVLLVGDDPWEQFVSCVRCIRILSPPEVQQMSEEGMQLLNANTSQ